MEGTGRDAARESWRPKLEGTRGGRSWRPGKGRGAAGLAPEVRDGARGKLAPGVRDAALSTATRAG